MAEEIYNDIISKFNILDKNDNEIARKSVMINISMNEIIDSINTIRKMLISARNIQSEINNTPDGPKKDLLIQTLISNLNVINTRLEKLISNSGKELLNTDKFKKLSEHLKEIIEDPTNIYIKDLDDTYFNTDYKELTSEEINQNQAYSGNIGGRKLRQPSRKQSSKTSNKRSKKGLKKKSKKLKGGYLYRKQNKSSKLSSTRKSKPSKKSKRKYFNY